jgi:S1-C subfamily serine protease
MHLLRILIFLLSWICFSTHAQQTAQSLFDQYKSAVYQIKIIDLESGNKSSIGSGFQIDRAGNIVTNHHVVSEYVYYPDKFRIEYLDQEGNTGELKLIDLDVINDLALVRKVQLSANEPAFIIAPSLPEQGSEIYSLGNPRDLGMSVVPGTFNGLKKNSFYQRIHFTGSINPGMSGGPAVDSKGQVMGVNVATAGNQIGFLIPLAKVKNLLLSKEAAPLAPSQFKPRIEQQLAANQQTLFSRIKNQTWKMGQLGRAIVPIEVTEFVSCWGDSNANDSEALYFSVASRCRIDEEIFLHRGLTSGGLELEFEYLEGKSMGSHRFYSFFTDSITGAGAGNKAGKIDVTNYRCQEDKVINIHGVENKTVLCLRAYKEYPSLYDVLFVSASLDFNEKGLIGHFTLAGVDKASALSFTQKFMDSIEWQ